VIKGKTIHFGYGDVLVGSNSFGHVITLTEIEPPKEIGTTPEKDSYVELQKIVLKVDDKHLHKVSLIEKKIITDFSIDDYTLDFSKYHEGSVNVVIKHIRNALYYNTLCLAC